MSLGHSQFLLATGLCVSLLAAVSVAESTGATTPDTTMPGTDDAPVGLIAIGHSGLTGENSDPDRRFAPALENSWATGTNPDVNSIYLRLIEIHPEAEGHVANTAEGGAVSRQLPDQARMAMEVVPTPELVIIQTIDNDLNLCEIGNDAIVRFGDHVTLALEQIAAASPQSRILIVSQFGRPEPAFDEQVIAAYPEFETGMTGTEGECGTPFLASGEANMAMYDHLTSNIEAFEAEQQRRCDAVPQCQTDDGAAASFPNEVENWAPIINHMNVRGLAAQAELMWPVVVDVLQLEGSPDQPVSSTEPAD